MLTVNDIRVLDIETINNCNAGCALCLRHPGMRTNDALDWAQVTQQVPLQVWQNLTTINFNGTTGDNIMHPDIFNIVGWTVNNTTAFINIHTNGSLRSKVWWERLAHNLKDVDHDVWFGIDGIGPTHEIYRQGTKYQKVIDNAQAFIAAGGIATWQFIPYAHNQHQLKDCIKLSQQYKFKKFKVIKSFRPKQDVKHWKTGKSFKLEPSDLYKTVFFSSKNGILEKKNCMHLEQPSIYVAASGQISPCCYFSEYKSFDSINDMLHNLNIATSLNIPDKVCLFNCGT